jgi:hypothetical protein
MARKRRPTQTDAIISVINSDVRQDMVILIVPSHDKDEKLLRDQDLWAGQAMELFADLYGGATAFHALQGIYKDSEGKVHHDKPILIESYVERSKLVDTQVLGQLLDFAKRMGKQARQKAVAIIINDVFHEITDY